MGKGNFLLTYLNINQMNTKKFIILCMWLMATCLVQAQMPQAISYQAVARDAQGKVVAGKSVGIQVEILKGSPSGTVVFSETHKPTSSKTGTVNLLIGQGTSKTGTFSSIDWGTGTYYLQLSMDLNGGSNYEKVSTTQMLPVPYALYAAKAGEVENGKGESVPSGDVPKFIIVSIDSEDLYPMMAGELEMDFSSGEGSINLECSILYMNGKDQHLNLSIEGLPGGHFDESEDRTGKSSSMGRAIDAYYIFSEVELPYDNVKLIVKDEITNQVVKEYPFKLVSKKK